MTLDEARAKITMLCVAAGYPAPDFSGLFVTTENLCRYPRHVFDIMWLLCYPRPNKDVSSTAVQVVVSYLSEVIANNRQRIEPDD